MVSQRPIYRNRIHLQRLKIAFEFAVQNIWSARKRMWLVVVGVGIGFGAIFSMLIIGRSVQAKIQSSLDSLGGDIVTLNITQPLSVYPFDQGAGMGATLALEAMRLRRPADEAVNMETLLLLLRAMSAVESAAPVYERTSCMFSSQDIQRLKIVYTSVELQPLLGLELGYGRKLHPGDVGQHNLLVGSATLEDLRQQNPSIGVGSMVFSCGQTWRIVGVMKPHPGSDFVQALQINNAALAAHVGPQPRSNHAATNSVLVRLHRGIDAQAFANQLVSRVEYLLPGHSVEAYGAWEFIKSRQEQVTLYAKFLAVLGSVSLLVGALGITNMMLVTVSERRAEIGLRMAIGANSLDIVIQFLCEGVLICLVGSMAGMMMGWGVAEIALRLAGFDAVFSIADIVQASVLAMFCGMVAGAYPAHKAATMDPVSCLQP